MKMYNPYKCDTGEIVYRRTPTMSEMRFGYGDTHYRTFIIAETPEMFHFDGTRKRFFKAKDDGLRYYR
jgi:hypothetical protein